MKKQYKSAEKMLADARLFRKNNPNAPTNFYINNKDEVVLTLITEEEILTWVTNKHSFKNSKLKKEYKTLINHLEADRKYWENHFKNVNVLFGEVDKK